jgi:hypothetical protein
MLALAGFDPATYGLWAHHASAAPKCCVRPTWHVSRLGTLYRDAFWPYDVPFSVIQANFPFLGIVFPTQNFTGRGARTHDHQVKSLALYRLS